MEDNFINFIYFFAFIFGICLIRKILVRINISPLIGDVIIGIIFGPHLLNLLVFWESIMFFGFIGLYLLILESGINFNIDILIKNWKVNLGCAVLGLILSFLIALLLFYLFNLYENINGLILSAFALAPTSIGLSLKVLEENKQLDTNTGQSIIGVTVLDDMLTIIIFSVLSKVLFKSAEVSNVLIYIILPIIFSLIAGLISIKLYPSIVYKILDLFKNDGTSHFEIHEQIVTWLFFSLAFIYGVISHYCGSILLGIFFAGLSFARIDNIHKIWKHQIKRASKWLSIFYFAGTVGFSIPILSMLNIKSFGISLIFTFLVGVLSKFMGPILLVDNYDKIIIGSALIGRGELSFLIANYINQKNIISNNVYAIIMWTILQCAIISPIALNFYIRKKKMQSLENNDLSINKSLVIISGEYHHNIIDDILDSLDEISYEMLSSFILKKDNKSQEIILIKNKENNLEDNELKSHILKAIGDRKEKIEIRPYTLEGNGNMKLILSELCENYLNSE